MELHSRHLGLRKDNWTERPCWLVWTSYRKAISLWLAKKAWRHSVSKYHQPMNWISWRRRRLSSIHLSRRIENQEETILVHAVAGRNIKIATANKWHEPRKLDKKLSGFMSNRWYGVAINCANTRQSIPIRRISARVGNSPEFLVYERPYLASRHTISPKNSE